MRRIDQRHRRSVVRVTSEVSKADSWALLYLELSVANPTSVGWPVFTSLDLHRVGLGCRWMSGDGRIVAEQIGAERLPYDLGPSAEVTVPVACRASVPPGDYDLVIGVTQSGAWFDGAATIPMKVVAPGAPAADKMM